MVWITADLFPQSLYAVQTSSAFDAARCVCNHLWTEYWFYHLHNGVAHYLPRHIILVIQLADLALVRLPCKPAAMMLREIQSENHFSYLLHRLIHTLIHPANLCVALCFTAALRLLDCLSDIVPIGNLLDDISYFLCHIRVCPAIIIPPGAFERVHRRIHLNTNNVFFLESARSDKPTLVPLASPYNGALSRIRDVPTAWRDLPPPSRLRGFAGRYLSVIASQGKYTMLYGGRRCSSSHSTRRCSSSRRTAPSSTRSPSYHRRAEPNARTHHYPLLPAGSVGADAAALLRLPRAFRSPEPLIDCRGLCFQ